MFNAHCQKANKVNKEWNWNKLFSQYDIYQNVSQNEDESS